MIVTPLTLPKERSGSSCQDSVLLSTVELHTSLTA